MASKMAAVGMEIIEMTIGYILCHCTQKCTSCVYLYVLPPKEYDGMGFIGFDNAKQKMAANMQMKAAITEIPFFGHSTRQI